MNVPLGCSNERKDKQKRPSHWKKIVNDFILQLNVNVTFISCNGIYEDCMILSDLILFSTLQNHEINKN